MLISHRKQFIFTKTKKTAGTSVESYFELYCMPDGEWEQVHARDEYVSEAGIIGYRGSSRSAAKWYHHMSAASIRDLIGREIWDSYYKFTVIRNPFDKLVSGFYMDEKIRRNYTQLQRLKSSAKRLMGKGRPIDRTTGRSEVERFRSWLRHGGAIHDRDKYLIDGVECVDYIIRYEALNGGIRHVCERLAIPFEPERIPQFKKGMRPHTIPVRDYFDAESEAIVRKLYAWEIERCGYELPG